MGDGECQEGTTWESMLIAGKLRLNNLNVIIDNNGIQGSGFVNDILPVMDAVEARRLPLLGGTCITLTDITRISWNYAPELKTTDKPNLIIANTIKGKGVSFMENVPKWHSTWLAGELEEQAMEELS